MLAFRICLLLVTHGPSQCPETQVPCKTGKQQVQGPQKSTPVYGHAKSESKAWKQGNMGRFHQDTEEHPCVS